MHILIAPNAFKNSLTATAATKAIARGLRQSRLKCTCACFPVGDGGDGTGGLLIEKCRGKMISAMVHDPLGRKIRATFGLIDRGKTAVIELANASGLRLLQRDELNPLRATTRGTGELIKCALDKNVRRIILCVGGSATVDGGVGILQALGIRFLDSNGNDLVHVPENLSRLDSICLTGLDQRILDCEIIIPCDVDSPLLGANGAAKIFGPQKGATPSDIKRLEAALERFSEIIKNQTGRNVSKIKHGGAAGGVPAGLSGLLNAKPVNGITFFLEFTRFDASLIKADLVITGEGRIDEQTLSGKGPYGVALSAKQKKIPVIGLAGKVSPGKNSRLKKYFDALLEISGKEKDLETAIRRTSQNLQRTAKELGNFLSKMDGRRPKISTRKALFAATSRNLDRLTGRPSSD